MRLGSLRSVPIAASSVQGKSCKARNGRWTGRPHRESPRASVSASPVTIYHNACLKTQSDRLLALCLFRLYPPDLRWGVVTQLAQPHAAAMMVLVVFGDESDGFTN